jgi:hypothetical protein
VREFRERGGEDEAHLVSHAQVLKVQVMVDMLAEDERGSWVERLTKTTNKIFASRRGGGTLE